MQRQPTLTAVSTALVLACGGGVDAGPTAGSGPDLASESAQALTVPVGFTDSTVVSGLSSPTAMAFAPDGRIFVAEQGGRLRVVKGGALLATPFLSVSVDSAGERGLLGVAIDPAFAANGRVYVHYTATSPSVHNRISRFTASGDVAAPGSEVVLVDLEPLSSATNHNGGAIHFGPDGKLYAGVGDNANGANAQSLATRLGKILRFNPDGSIPADNPFAASASGANRAIWALGLRNPFTFAFEPGSGRMAVNDVGLRTWEEVDEGVAGANYGWPATEGPTSDPRFRGPFYAYRTGSGSPATCAISGGAFYRPPAPTFPAAYTGSYFFADLCAGWIRRIDPASGAVADFASGGSSPVDLQVGPDGALYYLARGGGGVVGRIQYAASGGGSGLRGDYYDSLPSPRFVGSRLDPLVSFDWGGGSPHPAIAPDGFGVRWTGRIVPRFSELYRFHLLADDGVRLWLNGALVVSDWSDHPARESSGTIQLVAGQSYDLRLEYYDGGGSASVHLGWSSASQPLELVPTSRLFPP